VAVTVLSLLLAAAGAGLMLWALYQSMATALGSAFSAFITGLVALLVAGVISWIAHLIAR
jgi:hypothetical protein